MNTNITPEDAMNKIQRIFKKRGKKALDIARSEMLSEAFESEKAHRALTYFMTEYWHDLARPSLMAMACEAAGGKPEATIPVSIPMILISGALDIHDDIIDQSRKKDGRPTVYGKFGRDIALIVGDALLLKGLAILNRLEEASIPAKKAQRIVETTKKMFFELGDAEALELSFRHQLDVLPDQYLRVVRKKAADVEAHTRIGAVLGNASRTELEALGEYGRLLGTMIILRDDWLDILQTAELKSRITKESLPLPLLYCLHESKTKAKLKRFLEKRTFAKRDLEKISEVVQKAEALRKYATLMRKLAGEANVRLEKLKYVEGLRLLVNATISP